AEDGIRDFHVTGVQTCALPILTTIEYEPGLVHDLDAAFERIAPRNGHYQHEERWHDDNGHSHVRASLLGPSLVVPFDAGELLLEIGRARVGKECRCRGGGTRET